MQPAEFRARLDRVPRGDRDAWLDAQLGITDIPDDIALPIGCVPYLPCPIGRLVRVIDRAQIRDTDVFVDVGSGVGRAAAAVHLLTGARAIGLEIQPQLVEVSRALAPMVSTTLLDAGDPAADIPQGTIYFLYCPFSGDRLARFLANLRRLGTSSAMRIVCLDMTLPDRPWLAQEPHDDVDIAIYRMI
jgi:SAM-dependent methyltransferase